MRNVKYLQWAIMFILFALPSYTLRFKIVGIPITMLEVMILATFAIWFLNGYKQVIENIKTRRSGGAGLSRYPFDIEMVLLLIISFISVGVAGFSNEAFGIWKAYFFEPLLFYILLFNVFASPRRSLGEGWVSVFEKIIWPLTIAAFLISVFAIYQKITGDFIANPFWSAVETRRVVSVFAYPNALGLYLAPLVLLMTGHGLAISNFEFRILNKEKILKIIFLSVIIILSLLSIYFAHSEGAIVGVVAGTILFGLLIGKRMRLATMGVLIFALIMFFVNVNVHNKIVEKGTLSDFSGEVRKQQWRETWMMLTESPQRFILGAGLANYQTAVKPYHQEGIFFNEDHDPDFHRKLVLFSDDYKKKYWRPVEVYLYPHNIFLNFWSELGLLGALLMTWIIVKFYYIGVRQVLQNSKHKIQNYGSSTKENYIIITLLSAMTAIVIHGAVDVPYFKNDMAIMFWVLIALMGMGHLMINKEDKK
ncbi:O-antigen ligase family protein [Candidatus Parcubacteria bacterium]|nr:O-antigen ligase family protein [Patescibacteria group bacterium]MBU4309802.1 O-antigen ligase family protein [Patescibacteria group bacterium]MBU4432198.1 O-antigen ligase family protein [Patescibacteria group bacterium]MBU4578141.1 O-antigen ligase family protein [Patescibacteria group bacterium]MCG2696678.1 O-antigen ligase family protein [Candidatus Parcubacteria bacterium]